MPGFSTFHNPIHSPWWFGEASAAPDLVPWFLPVAINDHAYQIDFLKSRLTTMPVRRVSSDDSVEPGEQTLSAAGIWPRAQDNYFLGIGQEFLDNRFAFESVYVHSGEYPSVRTRGWKCQGVNLWSQGKMSLLPEYDSIATSTSNLLIVACGDYLYKTDGITLSWTYQPVGVDSPEWTDVTSANSNPIVSLTSDGSRVWFACGPDGVFETDAGSTSSSSAATPAALNGVGGVITALAAAGTVGSYMPTGSTDYYVTELDAFGNETQVAESTIDVSSPNPVNITWNPDTNASNFNVYRGDDTLVYTGDVPSFVDDGTVPGITQAIPTENNTGSTPYQATFILYAKGHLIASTGPDLVEILASGNITFIYQSENPNFVFNCGTELPSAIIVAGNSGGPDSGLAFVGALQPDTTNNGATLAPPTWATALPFGETINAIAYNAGSILLGTSLGVRTGTDANDNGVFDINPVIEDPGAVFCTAAWAQYQYFGWSNYDPAEPWAPERPTISGLGRADLSQYTTPGVPAYAPDVLSSGVGTTTQVVVMAGIPYFVVNDAGDFSLWGPDGNVVASAWFEPGWIRYGTLENKILVEVDFQHEPLPAGASVKYQIIAEDRTTITEVGVNDVAGSTTVDTPLSAGLIVGDRFMPLITLSAAPGTDTPAAAAFVIADEAPPVLPYSTPDGGATFNVTPAAGGGPLLFTMDSPDEIFSDVSALVGAMEGATAEGDVELGGLYSISLDPTNTFLMVTSFDDDTTDNGTTITEGNGGAASLGFTGDPDTMAGGTAGGVGPVTEAPVFLSHITKAMVTTKRQDEILLAILWADRVYSLGKSQKRWVMDCLAEYLYIKGLEGTGVVVEVTLLGITYSAYIDQVMMAPEDVDDMRTWFTGVTTVKLVTLSQGG